MMEDYLIIMIAFIFVQYWGVLMMTIVGDIQTKRKFRISLIPFIWILYIFKGLIKLYQDLD